MTTSSTIFFCFFALYKLENKLSCEWLNDIMSYESSSLFYLQRFEDEKVAMEACDQTTRPNSKIREENLRDLRQHKTYIENVCRVVLDDESMLVDTYFMQLKSHLSNCIVISWTIFSIPFQLSWHRFIRFSISITIPL